MASKEKQINISLVILSWPLRNAYFKLLSDLGYTVQSSYTNGKEMIANFANDAFPDIILIDADREEAVALETVCWLRKHHPTVKILAFTLEGEEALIKPLIDNGAHGYLCKAAESDEIKRAIKRVHEKGFYIPPLNPWRLRRC